MPWKQWAGCTAWRACSTKPLPGGHPRPGYNQVVRIPAVLILIVSLAACNSAKKNNDAVRQGVVDYLVAKGFEIPKAMTVSMTNLEMKGNEADATVSISPTGGNPAQGMAMKYHLEQKGDKWVVVGKQDSAANPHGGGAIPAAPAGSNPHEGGAVPGAAPGKMPSPEDLPPAKKQ
jgi:hypothetical protein